MSNLQISFFSLKSSYASEGLEVQKALFLKEKYKYLSIFQKEKLLCKLHSHLLEEDYESTILLFDTNHLSIPEEFDAGLVEVLVKYFYFKEIPPIPLTDIFPFFNLVFFMKVEPIISKIIDFLKENINDVHKVMVICKGALEFTYFFKKDSKRLIDPILQDCFAFLLKNSHFQQFLQVFDQRFFENNTEKLEEIFYFLLNLMKASKVPNEIIMKFFDFFKEPLLTKQMKIDSNFNLEGFFRKFFQEYLVLTDINIKEIEEFLKKLNIKENHERKELMVALLSQKIAKFEEENLVLKTELKEFKENEKMKEFEEKIKRNPQVSEVKIKGNTEESEEKIHENISESARKASTRFTSFKSSLSSYFMRVLLIFSSLMIIFLMIFSSIIDGNTRKFQDFMLGSDRKFLKNIKEFKEEITRNKEEIHTNIKEFKEELYKNTKDTEEKISKNTKDTEAKIQNLKIKLENQLDFEKRNLQDSFLALLDRNMKKLEELSLIGYSFCPENNDGNYSLSNLNRNLEKTSGGSAWRGFRCDNLINYSDKLIFSIKIEETAYCSIMIGFCVKTANNSSGYYSTSSSFMLSLYSGKFYNRSNGSAYINNFKGKEKEIYTSIFDVKLKSLEFLLNWKSLGAPQILDITNEEILLLCPCVDLGYQGDKINIIKTQI